MQFSRACLEDIPLLSILEQQAFPCDTISHRQFRYLISKAHSICIKATNHDTLMGYCVLLQRKNSKKSRIYSIAVSPLARNHGIAATLLSHAEQEAKLAGCTHLTLEVCEQNHAALTLYNKAGFTAYGKKANYYQDGCNAILFYKDINNIEDIP